MNHFNIYWFIRLLIVTSLAIFIFVFIFVTVDFSQNSDSFVARGATINDIWKNYYIPYIPEIIRLIAPVAVFLAGLFVVGQMSERFEIIALRSSGVSLHRMAIPHILFGICIMILLSSLDAKIIPLANHKRIIFEAQYLLKRNQTLDRTNIFLQNNQNSILKIGFYDMRGNIAHQVEYITYNDTTVLTHHIIDKITWKNEEWVSNNVEKIEYAADTIRTTKHFNTPLDISIKPKDIARRSSDMYQLTYAEGFAHISSLKRINASNIALAEMQLWGRIFYPLTIFIISIISLSIASVRRQNAKTVYLTIGLFISFLYLALIKILEPFGHTQQFDPLVAILLPHFTFFAVSLILYATTKK